MSTYEITIPANQEIVKNWSGRYVQIFASSGSFEIGLEGQSSWELAEQGLAFGPWEFSQVGFKNSSSDPITATISVTKYPVVDSRLNVVGALSSTVTNFPANQSVSDASILAMMQNDNDLSVGLTKMGASWAKGWGVSAVTIFTPAQNPNGAILRFAGVVSYSGSMCVMHLKSSTPTGYNDAGAQDILYGYNDTLDRVENLEIPAGQGMYFRPSSGNSSSFYANWDFK